MAKKHDDHIEEPEEQESSFEGVLEEALNEDADEANEQLEALTAELKRAQADFVNYKRRAETEKAELLDFAKTRVVRDFLSVRDTFDQEQLHRPKDVDAKWAASIDSIRNQFDSVLKGLGVERFESAGHAFDPHFHNAVAMDDGAGAHEVVTDELQAGYKLSSTILRHAMVRVGHSDTAPATSDPVDVIESESSEDEDVQPEVGK